MSIQPIKESEMREAAVASIAKRPSTPSLYGGHPLSADELRAAFDRLPRLIAERLNALITALGMEGEDVESIADAIPTGIAEGHTLADLLRDITSGALAAYLSIDGAETLAARLDELLDRTVLPEGHPNLLSYIQNPSGAVLPAEHLPISGGTARAAINDTLGEHDRALGAHAALQHALHAEDNAVFESIREQFRLCREEDGSYRLYCNTAPRGASARLEPVPASDRILIPRDMALLRGSVAVCEADGVPLSTLVVGEAYLDLLLSNGEHLYVRVADLVDRFSVKREGAGDILTDLTVDGAVLTVTRGASRAEFVTQPALDARLERIETAADTAFFSRQAVSASGELTLPAAAVSAAEIVMLGGRTRHAYDTENLLSPSYERGSTGGLEYSYNAERDEISLFGTAMEHARIPLSALHANGRTLYGFLETRSAEAIGEGTLSLCDTSGSTLITLPLSSADEPLLFDLSASGTSYTIDSLLIALPYAAEINSLRFRLAVGERIDRRLVAARPLALEGVSRVALPSALIEREGFGEGIDGEVYNYAVKEESGWRMHTRVKRRALTGTETVTAVSASPDAYGLYAYRISLGNATGTNSALRVLCSHYPERRAQDGSLPGVSLALSSRKLVLTLYSDILQSAAEVKAMLAELAARGTPFTVVYEQAKAQTVSLSGTMPRSLFVIADAYGCVRCQTDTEKAVPFSLSVSVPGGRFAEVENRVNEIAHRMRLRSWQEVQSIVRAGRAAEYFEIGDILTCSRIGKDAAFRVIGIDHDTPADPAYTHSLTLQATNASHTYPVHRREALFFISAALPIGDYYFTIPAGIDDQMGGGRSYHFRTEQVIPYGSYLCFNWLEEALDTPVLIYDVYNAKLPMATYTVTEGAIGQALTEYGHQNDIARIRFGIPYADSEVDAWLESTANTPYPDDNLFVCRDDSPGDGYLAELEDDFVAALGNVSKTVITADGTEETLSRHVFLLSAAEVGIPSEEGREEGEIYPYYAEGMAATPPSADAEPIRICEEGRWWLRTATTDERQRVGVGNQGERILAVEDTRLSILPALCIV